MTCPYFKGEHKTEIECTSFLPNAKAIMPFATKEQKRKYTEKYCDGESWRECIYARYMINRDTEELAEENAP